MTGIDVALVTIIGFSALLGVFRGLVREVVSLLSLIIALWLAWSQADSVAPFLQTEALASEPLRLWVARALVFFGVMLIGTVIAAIVGQVVRTSIFSGLDRFLGLLFGMLRGVLVVGLLVMLAQFLRLDQQPWWEKSTLLPYGEAAAALVRGWVGESAARVEPVRAGS